MAAAADPVRVQKHAGGAFWQVLLDAPKGNVIDIPVMERLIAVYENARARPPVRAVCLDSAGEHFSFGASVQEHLPERVGTMLPRFHRLVRSMLDSGVVLLAAIRGQCLGGGLELVALSHRVFAAPNAVLGQPEIKLGVFAPAASLVLPARVGWAAASDLCLTGRAMAVDEAARIGLVDEVTDDPSAAAIAWAETHLLSHSGAGLRQAVLALRGGLLPELLARLDAVEHQYLAELMATEDAVEGVRAFVEKRTPVWKNR